MELQKHSLFFINIILFFVLQVLQECPDQPDSVNDMEQFDEIEVVGKSLLDRLTVPVVYPDGYVDCSYNLGYSKVVQFVMKGDQTQCGNTKIL